MIDWIFEGIANWVASIMTQVMDAVSGVFLEALGTDMTAMEEYFPFVTAAYSIMQYTAWALLFLIVVWQLFRTFGGPITEAEHPFELLARGALFAFLITYAKPIFSLVLEIARAPYTALMESSLDPGDFTFAGIEQALTSGLTTIVSVATVVGLILLIVMMIALGWNYFKLLLETVERYVLVGVLCYTSPLAYAMGASKSTSRVFQSWCRMVGSQLLLLVLNVWFLRAFNSSVGRFVANGGALDLRAGQHLPMDLLCAGPSENCSACRQLSGCNGSVCRSDRQQYGHGDADGRPAHHRAWPWRQPHRRLHLHLRSTRRRGRHYCRCSWRLHVRLHNPLQPQQFCARCSCGWRLPDGRRWQRRICWPYLWWYGGP